MAKSGNNGKWLVFVDTNIWLDFYRLGGESADRQLAALERHRQLLITTDQVHMEFLKNRQVVIVDSIRQLTKPSSISVPPIMTNTKPAKALGTHLKGALEKYRKVTDKVEGILKEPSRNDPVYKSLSRIFAQASKLNLKRPDKQRYEVRQLARKRFVLGYPPRKNTDTSIGDAINWEWIIKCAQNSDENHNVLIVSRDGDFGISYGKETILNDWLHREFKEPVSRKRRVELTNKLTVALKRLDENVRPEDEKEEKDIISSSNESFRKSFEQVFHGLKGGNEDLQALWAYLAAANSGLKPSSPPDDNAE